RDILDKNKLCYIDNHMSSAVVGNGYTAEGIYCVLRNDSQKILIPSLHLEKYGFLSETMSSGKIMTTKFLKKVW
ncbi:MAG: hypothetical protein ACRCX2_32090, partial [Paraclostridium sp.]